MLIHTYSHVVRELCANVFVRFLVAMEMLTVWPSYVLNNRFLCITVAHTHSRTHARIRLYVFIAIYTTIYIHTYILYLYYLCSM